MTRAALATLLAALCACSAVYDAQYNDRKAELEKSRQLFLDGSTNVQFFTAAQDRLFWVDTPRAIEANQMHSIDTRGSGQVDYPWSQNNISASQGASQIAANDDLVVVCNVGQAFDTPANDIQTSPYPQLDTGSLGTSSTACMLAGSAVFYTAQPPASIVVWEPDSGSNVADSFLALGMVNPNANGFGFTDGSNVFYQEGVNTWLLPTSGVSPELTPFNSATAPVEAGTVAFDEQGVTFTTQNDAVVFLRYSEITVDPAPEHPVSDLISQGGYSLNFEHNDVQNIISGANYTVFDHHLIYEASGGIFAVGLDSGVVTDILLDGLADSDGNVSPEYRSPTVTANGTLFVQDEDVLAQNHPVYSVDLTGRLQ